MEKFITGIYDQRYCFTYSTLLNFYFIVIILSSFPYVIVKSFFHGYSVVVSLAISLQTT